MFRPHVLCARGISGVVFGSLRSQSYESVLLTLSQNCKKLLLF